VGATAWRSKFRRREVVYALGGIAAAWPLALHAQQSERVRRIGVLMALPSDDPEGKSRLAAFVQGLQKFGWTDLKHASPGTISICATATPKN
jgi:hypothetical protein